MDDQCEAGTVVLLELEGFTVDCATTVATGLSMACARSYDGIVLDQCLPDGSGLMVLEKLRSEGVLTPAMILTGFGDIQSAVAAMRLGALDYKQKPLIGDEWVDSVRGLVSGMKRSSLAVVPDPPAPVRIDDSAAEHLALLMSALRQASSKGAADRVQPVILLARAASNPALGVSAYVGCAEALRRALTASVAGTPAELAAEAQSIVTQSVLRLNVERHVRVVAAFSSIRAALTNGHRPSQEYVAHHLNVTVDDLERILEFNTGRDFTEWRSLLAIQLGAQRLADSAEQVAQIAYALGFEHPAQFTREFHRTLALTPTEFRRLLDT